MKPALGNVSSTLVLGIATAVAMWWAAYLMHLPVYEIAEPGSPGALETGERGPATVDAVDPMANRPAARPGDSALRFGGRAPTQWVVLTLGALMLAGGAFSGRYGWRVAVGAGLLCATINLLLLGSVLSRAHESESPNAVVPAAYLWVVGYLALGAIAGAVGAGIARRLAGRRRRQPPPPLGAPELAFLLAAATFLLIISGGLVTSEKAGMAVEDWPTTQGSNMFLYPLAKMTGGVFLEHSHRLFGSLIGLVTLFLAVLLLTTHPRRWARYGAVAVLVAVIVQGVLGGLRVRLDELYGTAFRIFHGVLGQVFFAAVVVFAVTLWRSRENVTTEDIGTVDPLRRRQIWFGVCVVVQLFLGALTRHGLREPFVYLHMMFAFVVIALGLAVSARPAFAQEYRRPLRFGAQVIAIALGLQLILGFSAFAVTAPGESSWAATLVATAHQAVGAIVLGAAVWQIAWLTSWRSSPGIRGAANARSAVMFVEGSR